MADKDTRPVVEIIECDEVGSDGSKVVMTLKFTFDKGAPREETRKALENMSVADLLGKIAEGALERIKEDGDD